jgi:hypothetical protein
MHVQENEETTKKAPNLGFPSMEFHDETEECLQRERLQRRTRERRALGEHVHQTRESDVLLEQERFINFSLPVS